MLAGSSSLEECFTDPELESFSQRLTARCYLGPFTREETIQFIRAQLTASRVKPEDIFSADAWTAVFEATDGVPRLVNQLCDRALMDADAAGRTQVDRQIIQATWADIQQLPTPWDTPEQATLTPSSRVIEFGNLASDSASFDSSSGSKYDPDQADAIVTARLAEFDTELDTEDEQTDEVVIDQPRTATPQKSLVPVKPAADPFAEKFDEEEVVLDNYAAWDDMFRRDTPRVVNRRDPEFSTLVQAAILATPTTAYPQEFATTDWSFEFDLRNIFGVTDESEAASEDAKLADDATWPPLRIADVSDAPAVFPTRVPAVHDDPVLIIEDDAPVPASPKPPVRREEYRNLFSRLRSG